MRIRARKPEFISFETQQKYLNIRPGSSTVIPIKISIATTAKEGNYHISIVGDLKTPVKETSNLSVGFRLIILDSNTSNGE